MSFVLTQYEEAVLLHVQSVLGFGHVRFDKGVNAYRYIVEDLPSITKLAYLFNGNLVLEHRIEQLSGWVSSLLQHGINLPYITTPALISFTDGWLSGFTDAEGCFNITLLNRIAYTLGIQPLVRFILDQNNERILKYIKVLVASGFVYFRTESLACFRYECSSRRHQAILIKYFAEYPLRTIKADAYIR